MSTPAGYSENPYTPESQSPIMKPSQSILIEADSLINGDRQVAYGTPEDNFARWRDTCRATGRPGLANITAEDIAVLMICGKICRDTNAPKADNLVDGAAYFEIWSRIRGL